MRKIKLSIILSFFLIIMIFFSACEVDININTNDNKNDDRNYNLNNDNNYDNEETKNNGENEQEKLNLEDEESKSSSQNNDENNKNQRDESENQIEENEDENQQNSNNLNLSLVDLSSELYLVGFCGDNFCDNKTESFENCCIDCGCGNGKICQNNSCVIESNFTLAPLNVTLNYAGPNVEKEERLIDKISTKDYLVVTVTKVEKTTNKNFDDNEIEEFSFFSFARVGDQKEFFKFPMKGTFNKRYASMGASYYDLFNINVDRLGQSSRVPIFSKTVDSLEDKNINIRLIVAEIDKPLVNSRIVYTDDINGAVNIIYDGNDILFDKQITLSASNNYNLGEHVIKNDLVKITYKVEIMKGLNPTSSKYEVTLYGGQLYKNVDKDENNEIVTYARVANDFAWDDFGASAKYNYLQKAASAYRVVGEGDSVFGGFLPVVREDDGFDGPFLYVETEFIDLDEKCKESDYGSMWQCLFSKKFNVIDITKGFYTAEEIIEMYENGKEGINIPFDNSYIGGSISIIFVDFH